MQSALFPRSFQLILIIGALLAAQRAEMHAMVPPVNSVIGDRSFVERFGISPDENTSEDIRIRTHLEYVERLLRARDISHVSMGLRAERIRNIDRLREYRTRGIFPRNYDHPGRRPCFIDRDGRICAVGYLVEQSAGRAAADAINRNYQYARVVEMRNEILEEWLAQSGLTLQEAAMIQPEYDFQWWESFYALEPSPMSQLALRGSVLKVITRAPDSVSIATMGMSGRTIDLRELVVVPNSSGRGRDTIRRIWKYGPEHHHEITWMKLETYVNQVLMAVQTTNYAYWRLVGRNGKKLQKAPRDSWEKFVEYQSLRDGLIRTDSMQYFDIDTLDRLVKLRHIHFPAGDTVYFVYEHDTFADTALPAGWAGAGVPVASIVDSLRRSGRQFTRTLQYRERSSSAWRGQRPEYEEINTWSGWTLTLRRDAKNGTYHGTAVQRDIWGLAVRELRCTFPAYDAYLKGAATFLGENTYEYTFDKQWNWIRRERKGRKSLKAVAATDEIVERTIEYF